jgi:hypothetical protein
MAATASTQSPVTANATNPLFSTPFANNSDATESSTTGAYHLPRPDHTHAAYNTSITSVAPSTAASQQAAGSNVQTAECAPSMHAEYAQYTPATLRPHHNAVGATGSGIPRKGTLMPPSGLFGALPTTDFSATKSSQDFQTQLAVSASPAVDTSPQVRSTSSANPSIKFQPVQFLIAIMTSGFRYTVPHPVPKSACLFFFHALPTTRLLQSGSSPFVSTFPAFEVWVLHCVSMKG